MSSGFVEVFRCHAKHPEISRRALPELERRLREILDACLAAWPGLDVPADAFMRHLAEHLPADGDLDGCLDRMHGPDLYLACGCVAGDPAALAAFESKILGQAVAVLRRMDLSASEIDEVVQVMRDKLLVGAGGGHRPFMASYAGRGTLVGWVRTVARRTALGLRRNKADQIGSTREGPSVEPIPFPADLELDFLKSRYQAEFQQAIEDAIATLGDDHVRVLRLHYTDGLSIDRIGALLSVHRATAARWIVAACDAVRAETRRLLHARLGLSASELDSLAGLVQSQLHLSLDRLLQAP